MNVKIMKQEAQYDWLKDEVQCLYAEKKELQERIDKAIYYIKCMYPWDKELLDILKGSDTK